MTIEEFIEAHKVLAIRIINDSKSKYLLDEHEISEIVHIGLWKSWRTFDASKSKVNTYITTVIRNMIYDFARKNRERIKRVRLYDSALINKTYWDDEPCFTYFTDDEWEGLKNSKKSDIDKLEKKVLGRIR